MKHDEYHRQFAEGVIEQIRQGTAPWQKPWGPGERVLPANVDTGRSYSGGNSLHLAAVAQSRGYADVRWGTYRQTQVQGGQVRKGEQGTRILSFQDHRKIAVNDEPGRPKSGTTKASAFTATSACPRPSSGSTPSSTPSRPTGSRPGPHPRPSRSGRCTSRPNASSRTAGSPSVHVAGDRAFYNLNRDEIVLPERMQFPSANHYYQTALHELGHSTGHPGAHEPRDAHPGDG